MIDAIETAAMDVLARLVLDAPFDACYHHIMGSGQADELQEQFIQAFRAVMTRSRLYSIQQDIEEERMKFYANELL